MTSSIYNKVFSDFGKKLDEKLGVNSKKVENNYGKLAIGSGIVALAGVALITAASFIPGLNAAAYIAMVVLGSTALTASVIGATFAFKGYENSLATKKVERLDLKKTREAQEKAEQLKINAAEKSASRKEVLKTGAKLLGVIALGTATGYGLGYLTVSKILSLAALPVVA